MSLWGRLVVSILTAGQARGAVRRRPRIAPARGWGDWLGEPRSAVLLVLAAVLLIGGGRKLLQGWRARGAVGRLGDPDVTPEEVEAAVAHGRAGLIDLFRILGTAPTEPLQHAAGHALVVLWARDELIAEEEQALVVRGYAVTWRARRRYPRALRAAIPIAVSYGIPFLRARDAGVDPSNLEWSHRIVGARRAALESYTPWKAGPGRSEFTLVPGDFETNGPHRLELHARVRTVGLTASWELDLPHMPFSIEFDPNLAVEALFALADDARAEAIARAVRLEPAATNTETEVEPKPGCYLDLNEEMAVRDPPALAVTTPLPCDLAHGVEVEFEGISGRFAAGAVVLSGQGGWRHEPESVRRFPLGPIAPLPLEAIDRPGRRRLRAVLTADPDLGWADPEVRSIGPGRIVTDWAEVQIVRR